MFFAAGIHSEWPWWDDLHAYWRELPNYNPQGVQSSEPGTMHASDAAALFLPADEDEEDEYDVDGEGRGDEQDIDGWDSREASPVDEGDQDAIIPVRYLFFKGRILLIQIQWDMTPPPPVGHVSTNRPPIPFSPVPSIQPKFATSPSPPPSTQPRHPAPIHPIGKRGTATQHGKPTLLKKTAVDWFNDSRQEENCCLNLKRKWRQSVSKGTSMIFDMGLPPVLQLQH